MENSSAGEISINNATISVESVKTFLDNNDLQGAKNFLNKFLASDPKNLSHYKNSLKIIRITC